MQNLNLKQLEVFVTVVECGSFTTAAERLYLAQSTVSGHLAALEKDLGLPLLIRTGKRKIILTDEGRTVYAHARTILQNCEDLSRQLVEHASLDLTLAASTIPMQYVLPQYLARFAARMPQCRFTLRGGDSETVHELVLSGKAQLGFVGAVLNRQDLQYDFLAEDELVLLAPKTPHYQKLWDNRIMGNALLGEPLIIREGGSGTKLAVDRFLCENQISAEKTHVVACMDNTQAILTAVSLGMGVAIVSKYAAQTANNTLIFSLAGTGTTRNLYLIRPNKQRLTKPAQAFYSLLTEQIQESHPSEA